MNCLYYHMTSISELLDFLHGGFNKNIYLKLSSDNSDSSNQPSRIILTFDNKILLNCHSMWKIKNELIEFNPFYYSEIQRFYHCKYLLEEHSNELEGIIVNGDLNHLRRIRLHTGYTLEEKQMLKELFSFFKHNKLLNLVDVDHIYDQ